MIRSATPADAARIGYVNAITWRSAYVGLVPDSLLARQTPERLGAMFTEVLNAGASRNRQFTLVGEDGRGEVVGFATAGASRHPEFPADAELWAIYVLPGHQGKGLGTRLLADVTVRLVADGFLALLVQVLADNPFRRFYETHGGRFAGTGEIATAESPLPVVSYVWDDLRALRDRLAAGQRAVKRGGEFRFRGGE